MTFVYFQPSFLFAPLCLGVLGIICGCATSPPEKLSQSDQTFTETIIVAHAAFRQDRLEEASTFYTLALNRARAIDRSASIGDAAYNLAACQLRLKQYDLAQIHLAEASHELERGDLPLADVLLLQARTAYLSGNTQNANIFISQLRTNPKSKPSSEHLAQAVILEGQMACDGFDWSSAVDLLGQARDYLGAEADALLQAQLAALTGRLAMGTLDLQTAAKAFDRQTGLLRHAGQYRAISWPLAQAGKAYSALNDHNLAADRLYRAARSAAAWGDSTSAKNWVLDAVTAAQKANDAVIASLAESLLSDLTTSHP